jgi:hypothetical protein
VAGPRVSADLVARATGESPEAVAGLLAEAVRARVLSQDAPGGLRFAHDLFRGFAYQELAAADRAQLHQRMGVELEAETIGPCRAVSTPEVIATCRIGT